MAYTNGCGMCVVKPLFEGFSSNLSIVISGYGGLRTFMQTDPIFRAVREEPGGEGSVMQHTEEVDMILAVLGSQEIVVYGSALLRHMIADREEVPVHVARIPIGRPEGKPRHNYHYVCAELMRLYYRWYELALQCLELLISQYPFCLNQEV
jgi:hypothetical protein